MIGNVVSRGNPLMEAILDRGLPYISGPQWLGEHVLNGKWVLAVAGTHGKTTTSSMLAWLLEDAGMNPGFLIGGVPLNFGISARLTDSSFFVIEADEYDTAFFDKRSKFVHYRPKHGGPEQSRIRSRRHLPGSRRDRNPIPSSGAHRAGRRPDRDEWPRGRARARADARLLDRSRALRRAGRLGSLAGEEGVPVDERFAVYRNSERVGVVDWQVQGEHNRMNALAAIAAARHVGVPPAQAAESLASFRNVKRRMEVKGSVDGVTVYDDFAHHPTAIETTVAGLRTRIGATRRGFSPCSNRARTR